MIIRAVVPHDIVMLDGSTVKVRFVSASWSASCSPSPASSPSRCLRLLEQGLRVDLQLRKHLADDLHQIGGASGIRHLWLGRSQQTDDVDLRRLPSARSMPEIPDTMPSRISLTSYFSNMASSWGRAHPEDPLSLGCPRFIPSKVRMFRHPSSGPNPG